MAHAPMEWEKTIDSRDYLISTCGTKVSMDFIKSAFAHEQMYWARPISDDNLKTMLDNSVCLGLYVKTPNLNGSAGAHMEREQIGMGRLITDYVTFAYLTDVFIEPEYQGSGLGKWLIACCKAFVENLPALRGMVLLTSGEKAKKFYKEQLNMELVDGSVNGLEAMMMKAPGWGKASS